MKTAAVTLCAVAKGIMMANKVRTYEEAMVEIHDLLKTLRFFKDMPLEDYLENFAIPLREIFQGKPAEIKDDQYYFKDPKDFFAQASVTKLHQLGCPYYKELLFESFIVPLGKRLTKVHNSWMFDQALTMVIAYVVTCRIPGGVDPKWLNEPTNYFTTVLDKPCIYDGEFEKIPSTLFGGEEISLLKLELPEDKDCLFAYNPDGVLRSILTYHHGCFQSLRA